MTDPKWRPNVGMIVANAHNQVLWAKRADKDAWQFPQGGINPGEAPEQAMYRELNEELGLEPGDVEVLAISQDWQRYNFSSPMESDDGQLYHGQEQKWFLLRLLAEDEAIKLEQCAKPEFDTWKWVDYWLPQNEIVEFKKDVYVAVMREFSAMLGIK